MDLNAAWIELLKEAGPGKMMTTAYDTAWVARLAEIGEPIGELALEWLREHQLPDGSWGAEQPCYYHDRVICTLAAINALGRRARPGDRDRLQRAEAALEVMTSRLPADRAGETIGFELIAPTLFQETRTLGVLHREEIEALKSLAPLRSAKLALLPHGMINRSVTMAFSAEMAGNDGKGLLDVEHLQEQNGSISYSPSATAYFTLYVRPYDPHALAYLHAVAADGTAPNVSPIDVFEQAWVLWNLKLTESISDEILQMCHPHLDFLKKDWTTGKGIGFAANYGSKDSDVTSLVYDVLSSFGISVDLEAVLRYEQPFYFRCYDFESNPSVSANIHVLGALRCAGFEKTHSLVQKVLNFLAGVRTDHTFWFDKWHASPYYATSHAIISCSSYVDDIVTNAFEWILKTQNRDGSWGYYMPTAEETAYCLQALAVHQCHGHKVPLEALHRGSEWLIQHSEPPYPPLWIGKCLYSPILVVRSAILSALLMVNLE
ncbi:MAG TPA: prenyltransferase/squalene oxidase repeat-containing protein [Anaerolineae bacterium]|nr:prenyltransferase/squalene oxidase repeat-containing protein [Anaerolineae bacterium]HQH38215.1 prenyltransferase/squalene oxidase repeat-containing protein [Anaerolineae bacterium]